MVKHYFQTPDPDLAVVQKRLVFWFKEREYEVDSGEADGIYLIQSRKTGKLRTLTGMNIAFKIRLFLSDEPNEFVFESATGQWAQNIAGAGITALFTGGITLLTGAAGAGWAMKVERDIVDFMENSLQFRKTRTVDDKGATKSAPPPMPGPPPIPGVVPVATAVPPPIPKAADAGPCTPRQRAERKAAEDLKKLATAHTAGILTDEEYAAKKAAIDAKTDEYEVQFVVEEKAGKLKDALTAGILDQAEYDAKVADLAKLARESIQKERSQKAKAAQLTKLKAAMDAGILTQEEFDTKVKAMKV